MPKKTALVVLIAGLAFMVFALVDPTGLGQTGDAAPGVGSTGALGTWTMPRLALLAAGALVGVLGAYGVAKGGKKDKKKKK